MPDQIHYYAIVGRGRNQGNPSGLARRRRVDGQRVDESLRHNMSWGDTTVIAEWDRGEEITRDLVEISEEEAQALIERFRQKWSGG